MKASLTKKQKQIYDYIVDFIKDQGYSPSYKEVAEHFGLSSIATVHQHISVLQSKNYLRPVDGQVRALAAVEEKKTSLRDSIMLPLAGIITAGEPIEALQTPDSIQVPIDMVRNENSFVLKVKGDSMIEDGILDGDYVVVENNTLAKNGDTIVALIDNEYATLKRYYREENRFRLQPANSSMKAFYVKNLTIQGIVRAVFRIYA